MKTHKETLFIGAYMHAIKLIFDDIVLNQHSFNDNELIIHVLNGLGSNFKELYAAIKARDAPISFEKLYDKLLDQESTLKCDESSTSITSQFN